ncbi:hypothetical protein [Ferdinandcohnia sp. Marseille-Q9671]
MNFITGLYHTIFHPRLILIPLFINVILLFIGSLGVYIGFSLLPHPTMEFPLDMIAIFPIGLPLIEDVNFPYRFIQTTVTNNWLLSIIAGTFILLIKSYALGMYLGSMKSFLEGPDNTYSALKIAAYYYKNMVLFSLIELIVSGIILILGIVFWPLALVAIIIVCFYSLTPYLIVIEDTTISQAITKSPYLFIKNFQALIILVLIPFFFLLLMQMFSYNEKTFAYYFVLLLYSFLGTATIFAIMNCLHKSIFNISLPPKRVRKSRNLYPLLWLTALLLPLLGAWLAT